MPIDTLVKTENGPGLVVMGTATTSKEALLDEITTRLAGFYDQESQQHHTFVYRGKYPRGKNANASFGQVYDPSRLDLKTDLYGYKIVGTEPVGNVRLVSEEKQQKPLYSRGSDFPETATTPVKPQVTVFFNPNPECSIGGGNYQRDRFFKYLSSSNEFSFVKPRNNISESVH